VTTFMREVLEDLGFHKFDHPLSAQPAYAYSFGPYGIEAMVQVNRWFRPCFMLSGTVNTGRTTGMIEAELPLEVESIEQGVALLSYYLAGHIPEQNKPAWLRIGERMTSHLPWQKAIERA